MRKIAFVLALGLLVATLALTGRAAATHGGCTVSAPVDPYTWSGQGHLHIVGEGYQTCDTYMTQKVDVILQRHDWWIFWSDVGATNNNYVVAWSTWTEVDRDCPYPPSQKKYRARVVGQYYSPTTGRYESGTVYTAEVVLNCGL